MLYASVPRDHEPDWASGLGQDHVLTALAQDPSVSLESLNDFIGREVTQPWQGVFPYRPTANRL